MQPEERIRGLTDEVSHPLSLSLFAFVSSYGSMRATTETVVVVVFSFQSFFSSS